MRVGWHRAAAAALAGVVCLGEARVPVVHAQAPESFGCAFEPGPERSVSRIVDAMTVELDDKVTVRLVGILAPRAEEVGAAQGAWPAEAAALDEVKRLLQGRSVALAFTGPRSDRYGRTLAHLLLRESGRIGWVQRHLVASGHARVSAWPDAETCIEPLLAAETEARQAGRGLWAEAAYQVRPADRPSELQRFGGSFQIVTGRIARATGSRNLLVLEFASGEERAPHFRVVARRSAPTAKALGDARKLAGAEVEVRGWLATGGRGPEIELLALHQLRRLPDPVLQKQTPGR